MKFVGFAVLMILLLVPRASWACACGCGVFEVGTSSMLPSSAGGMLYIDYDYQNQYENWKGDSRAPAENNDDKKIETSFVTIGVQYMVNRSWGFQIEAPYSNRSFVTTGGDSGMDNVSNNWGVLGDMRIKGIYTGFSPDMSNGVTFGFKLPTGNFVHNDAFGDIDRDTEIGTGSTDILLGAFHRGDITKDGMWSWYVQGELDLPMLTQNGYRPGTEVDVAGGIYYNGWSIGDVKIVPIGQIIGSERTSDSGPNSANPVASGYQRVLVSPGIEVDVNPVKIYGDVEIPIYQNVTGNQLVAPALFKISVSYAF